jgi:hypothetical protein
MKEASGELNMTLVTVIAVGAILAFAMWFVPQMLDGISGRWNNNATINVTPGP